jgi:hypothetical protein
MCLLFILSGPFSLSLCFPNMATYIFNEVKASRPRSANGAIDPVLMARWALICKEHRVRAGRAGDLIPSLAAAYGYPRVNFSLILTFLRHMSSDCEAASLKTRLWAALVLAELTQGKQESRSKKSTGACAACCTDPIKYWDLETELGALEATIAVIMGTVEGEDEEEDDEEDEEEDAMSLDSSDSEWIR